MLVTGDSSWCQECLWEEQGWMQPIHPCASIPQRGRLGMAEPWARCLPCPSDKGQTCVPVAADSGPTVACASGAPGPRGQGQPFPALPRALSQFLPMAEPGSCQGTWWLVLFRLWGHRGLCCGGGSCKGGQFLPCLGCEDAEGRDLNLEPQNEQHFWG